MLPPSSWGGVTAAHWRTFTTKKIRNMIVMDDYTVVLKSSTDLLYAVPTLLGFYPRDSLVTVGLDRGERSWRV